MCSLSESDFPHECAQQPELQENENYENRKERSLVFHLIYAMEAYDYDVSLESIIDSFNHGFELEIDPQGELAETAQAIIDLRSGLDEDIKPLLTNWRFERIGVCTKLILRMAIWELQNTSIEPKIIINEAIELAKCFAERDAYKFVNGILDQMLKKMGKVVVEQSASE